jgi:DNA-binding transcriptional MerR regulator
MKIKKSQTQPLKRKLRTQGVCERYDVVSRTVDRWVEQGVLPKPMVINNVRYWDEDELDRRDQDRVKEANTTHWRGQQGSAA